MIVTHQHVYLCVVTFYLSTKHLVSYELTFGLCCGITFNYNFLRFFALDLYKNQLRIHGLHITLGVDLQLSCMFQYAENQIDLQITGVLAICQHKITNDVSSEYIEKFSVCINLKVPLQSWRKAQSLLINELYYHKMFILMKRLTRPGLQGHALRCSG